MNTIPQTVSPASFGLRRYTPDEGRRAADAYPGYVFVEATANLDRGPWGVVVSRGSWLAKPFSYRPPIDRVCSCGAKHLGPGSYCEYCRREIARGR